ncbi:PTS sugar transporter subunit IIA [Maridesulfovibrio hydrothermalis]|uniref:PTS system fructose subfamily IIA component n=1 Tax=Maridesulfovibrio hydrothermalis AM13 = DSM 14728 TaxID=1121451 RepID=L0RDF3_9BACT|nr:PTS sugar transporter subunit IIA [Maridesulfovibrio hydrothermalis]CCO24252.1 PTS system fructose subfamily IIA component [Maridesulfovibrio hydrothermalis AM13 = DSM 14728]
MGTESSKIGIVLVTHGNFGQALVEAAELIVGPQDFILSLSVDVSHGIDAAVESLKENIAKVSNGVGVLVLTDMFGGTPTNLSLSLLQGDDIEVVTGASLPMLLKALQKRNDSLEVLAEEVRKAGIKGIVIAGEMLRKRTSKG